MPPPTTVLMSAFEYKYIYYFEHEMANLLWKHVSLMATNLHRPSNIHLTYQKRTATGPIMQEHKKSFVHENESYHFLFAFAFNTNVLYKKKYIILLIYDFILSASLWPWH